jgi:hypothetical protein
MGRLGPFGALLAAVLTIATLEAAYVAAGVSPSVGGSLSTFALALAFVLWIDTDARRQHITPCHDFGFLVAVFFPFSLLWYVLWSRGRRGLLVLGALFGLMLLPWLLAVAVWILRSGLA